MGGEVYSDSSFVGVCLVVCLVFSFSLCESPVLGFTPNESLCARLLPVEWERGL